MPKLGMEPIRRQQLIAATIASVGRHGYANTTVQIISRAAGVSSGIVHHYFGGKDELFEATMRSMLRDLRADVVARLNRARTPRDRLAAVIDGNFAPGQFEPQVANAWLAFWAQAPHSPALSRLQRMNNRRLLSNLRDSFRHLLPADRVDRAARGMAAMIDGLWLNGVLTGATDGAEARRIALDYLESLLARTAEIEHAPA
jgi:TetR/AcrR family transcriptional repressor of bet genes